MKTPVNIDIANEGELLDRLVELARKNADIAVLWLYGSRAAGRARPDSDIDLAVAFDNLDGDAWDRRLRPETLALDWAATLRLPSGQVSVVDVNSAPAHLALNIMREDRVLLVKDPLRLAREENRISSVWEIDHLYEQRHAG